MSDVTVIGLGPMGSALAGALLRGGHRVTVWNRTGAKADPLVRHGAVMAPDLASGVAASSVVVTALKDLPLTEALLTAPDVRPRLVGRTVVQLGGATPREARQGERWAHDSGAEYLEGEIMVGPETIGTPEAAILIAGPQATFRRCEHLLRSIAPKTTYLGEQIGSPHGYGLAVGAVINGAVLGAFHGALICEAEGLSLNLFAESLREGGMADIGAFVDYLLARIVVGRYDEPQATIDVAATGAEKQLQHARDTGLDPVFSEYVANAFGRGVAGGLGHLDVAALIDVLRREN